MIPVKQRLISLDDRMWRGAREVGMTCGDHSRGVSSNDDDISPSNQHGGDTHSSTKDRLCLVDSNHTSSTCHASVPSLTTTTFSMAPKSESAHRMSKISTLQHAINQCWFCLKQSLLFLSPLPLKSIKSSSFRMFQHDVTTLVRTSHDVDSDVIVAARCDADVTREHGKAEGSRSCEEGKEWLRHNTAVTYACATCVVSGT